MVGMTGLLKAQMNLDMASKVQSAANSTIQSGKIRIREGVMSEDDEMIEEGQKLKAAGEEAKSGCLEHIKNAIDDINAAAKEGEEAAKVKAEEKKEKLKTKEKEDTVKSAEIRKTGEIASQADIKTLSDKEYADTPEVIVEVGSLKMTVESIAEPDKSISA